MAIGVKFERHIRSRIRPDERVKVGDTLAVQTPPESRNELIAPLSGLIYDCQYFIKQRYAKQYSGSGISATADILTFNHQDSGLGTNSSFSQTAETWTDTSKSWTTNEWVDHYLKVNGVYYLITANTSTVLTIVTAEKANPDDSLDYTIVPFIPDQLIDAVLLPDNTGSRTYAITDNDETTITVTTTVKQSGTVTTGDASAPYDTFIDTSKQGTAGNDHWNNYTCKFTSGNNSGVSKKITDFVDASGTFITEAFSAAINVSDTYEIHDNLLWVDNTMTFEIRGYVAPKPADFLDTTLAPIGEVFNKTVQTSMGELNEASLPDYFNAIYSIVITANRTATAVLNLDCNDAIRIIMKNQTSGDVQTILDSGFAPNTATEAVFHFVGGEKYRIDIAFYAENGDYGFRLGTDSFPFGWYISSWESALPSPPEWVSITGSGDAGDPVAHDREIILRFQPPNDMFSVQPPGLGSA